MIEAYKIAVNMTLTGDAHKKMSQFAVAVQRASDQMDKFHRILPYINKGFADIESKLRKINPQMKMFSRSIFGLGSDSRRTSMSMNYLNQSLIGTEGNTRRLKYQTDTLRNSMNSLAAASRNARAGINNVGGGRVRSGGRGGGVGGGAQAGMTGAAMALGSRTFAAAGGIYGGYRVAKAGFDKRAEYTSALAITKGMGYGSSVIGDVESATGQGSPGLSPISKIHAYNAALMATQNPTKAAKLYPSLATAMTVAPTIFGGLSKHQLEEAVRSAEILAGGDEGKMASSFSDVLSMMFTSGGTIMPNKIKHLVRKNPNLTRMGMLELEPVVQEMGGDVVSTALQTGRMQLLKGQMGKYQAMGLKSMGILGDVKMDKNGRPIGSKYGDLKKDYRTLADTNPTEFLKQVILPLLAKQGVTEPEEIQGRMRFLFASTYGTLLTNIYKNLPKSNEIAERANRIPGIEGAASVQPGEEKARKRFTEAWDTFAIALGKFESPTVIKGLNLTSWLLEKLAISLSSMSSDTLISSLGASNPLTASTSLGISAYNKAQPYIAKVNIDGKRAGNALVQHFMPNSLVEHGTTAPNIPLSGTSNAYSGNGGTFSQ